MAQYNNLKQAIQAVIRTNDNNEITGALLQQSLLAMINSLGAGYQYMGVASPNQDLGTPDQKVFYFTSTAGSYMGQTIPEGRFGVVYYDSQWRSVLLDVSGGISDHSIAEIKLTNELIAKLFATGYKYLGIATPDTTPTTPNQYGFYIANQAGTYQGFGNITIADGELAILYYNNSWHKSALSISAWTNLLTKNDIVNDLTTGGANKALSAEMGKRLAQNVVTMTYQSGVLNISGVQSGWTPTGDISEYEQSGLVLQLDGIERGNQSGHWLAYIGDADFTANGVTFGTDHALFPNNTNINNLSAPTIPNVAKTAGTIEIVFESDLAGQNRFLFFPIAQNALCLAFASNGNRFIIYTQSYGPTFVRPTNSPNKVTLSINDVRAMQNGESLASGEQTWFGDQDTVAYIGKRKTATAAQTFVGKIYAIRVYNRKLTEAEMRHNQSVDRVRFNF